MNDRELLEAAAKAAGVKVLAGFQAERDAAGYGDVGLWTSCTTCWNPLTDDGQALRLAVKLRIKFRYNEALGQGLAWTGGPTDFEGRADIEKCGRDENACARLAIVRAAAEVGKAQAA